MLVYDPMSNPLNRIEWMFGFLECVHIVSFGIGVGSIAIVDFRLLGLGLTNRPSRQLLQDTFLWSLIGLTFAITSGLLLFSTDPQRYAASASFQFKMIMLIAATIYNFTIHRKIANSESSPFAAGATAVLSLVSWVAIIFGGLFYAFT
jgi:hypothetical protein